MTRKRKHVDGKLRHKQKKAKKVFNFDDSERDIFAFINRKLEVRAQLSDGSQSILPGQNRKKSF